MKNYSVDTLLAKLKNVNWFETLNCDDVESAWSSFKNLFTKVLDEVAPIKQVRLMNRTEPWITDEILELIRSRDKILVHYRKSKDETIFRQYKKLQYTVQKHVKKAKSDFFQNQISKTKIIQKVYGKP